MAAQSFPPPSSNLSSKVELSVSCSKLKNLDHFSKSDPVVFLYCRGREVEWTKVGRTELIENNLNPKFSTTFNMEYRFEEVQNLQFAVYDADDKHHVDNIDKQQLLGTMECTLAEIVAAGVHLTKPLGLKGNPAGTITIQAEEVRNSEFVVYFELSATKLEKKDLFGKSDPYIEIAKAQEGGEFTVVYRSMPIMKTLSPRIFAECLDFCQVACISYEGADAVQWRLGEDTTVLSVGLEQDNQYLQAIQSVGSVLVPYDSDQMIPAFGFGARVPPFFNVSHCFPLDLNTHKTEVYGVQGILNAYQYAVRNVKLNGPTNFSSILDKAIQYASARESHKSQNYFILLIITEDHQVLLPIEVDLKYFADGKLNQA
ncbi:hypothetical protein EMCRGX_G028080 [Ephydatia muelleri]